MSSAPLPRPRDTRIIEAQHLAVTSSRMFLELAYYVPIIALVFGVLGLSLGAGLASLLWWLV